MRRTWDPTLLAVLAAIALLVGTLAATGGVRPGDWRGEIDSDPRFVRLDIRPEVEHGRMRVSESVPAAELAGFDAASFERPGAPLQLAWRRDAGALLLDGEGGRHARGRVRFEPDAGFAERWRAFEFEPLGDDALLRMALQGVRLADVERLHELGYRGVSVEQVLRLTLDFPSMDFLEGMQQLGAPLALDELFRLAAHGVSADEARALLESVPGRLGSEGLLLLHDHGIDAAYVRDLSAAGVGSDDLEGIVRLHARGIAPEYVAGVRAAGLAAAGIEEITRLHDQGIETEYVRATLGSGLVDPSLEDVIRLHAHGVPTGYVQALALAGPGKRGADAVILLHDHGVGEDWVRGMAEAGYGDLETEEMARLHAHGVAPGFVRRLAASGRRGLAVDDLIRVYDRGPEALDR